VWCAPPPKTWRELSILEEKKGDTKKVTSPKRNAKCFQIESPTSRNQSSLSRRNQKNGTSGGRNVYIIRRCFKLSLIPGVLQRETFQTLTRVSTLYVFWRHTGLRLSPCSVVSTPKHDFQVFPVILSMTFQKKMDFLFFLFPPNVPGRAFSWW
jgi:hypothetical protein